MSPARVDVRLADRAYGVCIGRGVLEQLGPHAAAAQPPGRAFLVVDTGVPAALVDSGAASLRASGFAVHSAMLTPSEPGKSVDTWRNLLVSMARARIERGDLVVALGGGIVGDVAGFAAASYKRGVPVIQCPTTLLSMVDASVGGKTGVNLDLGAPDAPQLRKNFIGAFHQPRAVLADIRALDSLPSRHFRAGLAECIKHGMIGDECGDPGLLDWTEARLDAILALHPETLTELIARNVAIKARIVESDEREEAATGGRALLNLGHTFAHAIETLPSLSPDAHPANAPLQHGEAVGLGLLAAARCAAALGLTPPEQGGRISALLSRIGLPTEVRGLPPTQELLSVMAQDKKTQGGRLRVILPTNTGSARVVVDPAPSAVTAAIDSLRAS